MKRLLAYLLRWQLSTPILAVVITLTTPSCGNLVSTIIANLIGGLIFFKIDQLIFNKNNGIHKNTKGEIPD